MLSSPTSIIFFAVFAIILVVSYLAIRREWLSTGIVAGLSLLGSIVMMLLVSLSQGNTMFQALVVSIGLGSIFSLATVAIALFFHTNELREQRQQMNLSNPSGDVE